MSMDVPAYKDVVEAHTFVQQFAQRTPILRSGSLDEEFGGKLYFKCENFQKSGSFKFRGATNAVMSLTDANAEKGVCTHSSGNHAAALALAARKRGIDAYVVMPETAPEVKKNAVARYGAKIFFCRPTLEARESTLAKVAAESGATEIHPYDHFKVIAGQGTAAKELVEDGPDLDVVLAPVGGGGLLAGTALSVSQLSPRTKVVACEPEGADDAYRSFQKGEIIPSTNPDTIADGLLTSLGERNFTIIRAKVDDIVTVSEESIILAMRMIWERMKIVIEPSSAVPLGALIDGKIELRNQTTGIILSGGNLDLEKLPF